MNDLHSAVDDYLAVRRGLGYKLDKTERFLRSFVAFCDQTGTRWITTQCAVAWARQPADADPAWWADRLRVVRVFAKYLHAIDSRTEVPPSDVLAAPRSHRAEPYLYSGEEIAALPVAARALPTPLRAATYETLVGLLTVTGMRVGEAIRLDRADVDWSAALVTIRETKFAESRQVPLHDSTVATLKEYRRTRDTYCRTASTPAFLVSTAGTRLIYSNVQHCFAGLVREAGLVRRSQRCRPRIHDLRHSFAVATLTRWYRDGLAIDAHLHRLSTYLGHADPSSTYWYLTATPELLGLAVERLEAVRETRP